MQRDANTFEHPAFIAMCELVDELVEIQERVENIVRYGVNIPWLTQEQLDAFEERELLSEQRLEEVAFWRASLLDHTYPELGAVRNLKNAKDRVTDRRAGHTNA